MFTKVLIANRGEIACRIAKTCKNLGIKTVAVYSEADQDAQHVKACDEARYIGQSEPKESYLIGKNIIEVALETGAQAIHPGYGFLSENADFAKACADAGIIFIGPPVGAIEAMGSKSAAKTLMESAEVPLVPGYHGDNQALDFLHDQADLIGYPVLLKASAGGGGKGMRIVEKSADFQDAVASCKREALSSFGNDKILIEKYLSRPRHIEVQVFSDQHQNHIYLFDRDCSVQRRHQKVIEEAPAPFVSEDIRKKMGQAAVNAAKAVNYEGAGTVEFIVEADQHGQAGKFFFMEMNTRLQVEHPVTEMITGLDLVEWQLRVASGEKLPLLQDQVNMCGHAIEARIYAENPYQQFLPSTGKLVMMQMPSPKDRNVRIDAGVTQGDVISPYYDPMIAKLIVWGKDRHSALAKMSRALSEVSIIGVTSNISFLSKLMQCESFVLAHLDTGLIQKNEAFLLDNSPAVDYPTLALLVAKQLMIERDLHAHLSEEFKSPWHETDGWRMNTSHNRIFQFSSGGLTEPVAIEYDYRSQVLRYQNCQKSFQFNTINDEIRITLDNLQTQAKIIHLPNHPKHFYLFQDGNLQEWDYLDPLDSDSLVSEGSGTLTAPMPGKVLAIHVKVGDMVKAGSSLMILEAMKMEFTINAPYDGEIANINFSQGQQVTEGSQLISFVKA